MARKARKPSTLLFIGLCFLMVTIIYIAIYQNFHSSVWNMVFALKGDALDSRLPRIFFVETSGKETIQPREACAVEAAAAHHPNRIIQLYNVAPFNLSSKYMALLLEMPNVEVGVLNLPLLFRGTPLHTWHEGKAIQGSQFPLEHMSDATRLAVLWKKGGIYLDTDVIVVRSMDDLHNAIGIEHATSANGAILVFDKEHPFLRNCMAGFAQNYSKNAWGEQGPVLVTQVVKQMCNVDSLSDAIMIPKYCQGISVHREVSFYPIPWQSWEKFFQPWDSSAINTSITYTVHLYGKITRDKKATPGDGSVMDHLMKNHCPMTYYWMKQKKAL